MLGRPFSNGRLAIAESGQFAAGDGLKKLGRIRFPGHALTNGDADENPTQAEAVCSIGRFGLEKRQHPHG